MVGPMTRGLSAPPPAGSSHTFCAVTGSSSVTTMAWPSGDQAVGPLKGASDRKNGCSGAASATVLMNRFSGPSRSALKTTRVPSGDQTGPSFRPGPDESGEALPRERSTSHNVDSEGDVDRTMTACVPSGEIDKLS